MGKYVKETWVDRNVQYPARYDITKGGGGAISSGDTVTMTASPGTITAAGTQIVATKLQNLEDQVEDITNSEHNYGASSAGTDAYALTFSPAFTAYNTGMTFNVKADVGNTGACTLDIDTIGVKNIKVIAPSGKADPKTGDIIANGIYQFVYDGTDFILLNPNSLNNFITTAQGDILYASATNTISALTKGTAYQVLRMNSGATAPEWGATSVTGRGTDNTTVVSGSSTNTKSIALGITASKAIVFIDANNASYTGVIVHVTGGTGAFEAFETQTNGANGITDFQSGIPTTTAYKYDSLGSNIRIYDVYISGTDLVIKYENIDASSRSVNINYSYTAWV